MPSGPRTDCGVSTWISKRSARCGRPRAASSRSQASTIASTWATLVTLGRVTTTPSSEPPAATSPCTNRVSVRTPRPLVGPSNERTRIPAKGGAVPSCWVAASAPAAASTSAWPASVTVSTVSLVLGSRTSKVSPEDASRRWPPMYWCMGASIRTGPDS